LIEIARKSGLLTLFDSDPERHGTAQTALDVPIGGKQAPAAGDYLTNP
jgi:hypothetical protein